VLVSQEALVPAHPFYHHLGATLDLGFVRELVRDRYAVIGRPSLDPVVFFKLQLILFFEGLHSERQLIRDQDAVYAGDFRARAQALGIETVLTPVQSPSANAFAEHWVGTVRRECLDWLLNAGERHPRHALREYTDHDNAARPHRALRLCPPLPRGQPVTSVGPVLCHGRLGGLLHEYSRCAA
jgi:transposase InsO family protein